MHGNTRTLHVSLFIHKVPFARSAVIGWTESTLRYVSAWVGQWERSAAPDAPACSARRVQSSSCVQLSQFLQLFNTALREQYCGRASLQPLLHLNLEERDGRWGGWEELWCWRYIRSSSQSGVSCASVVADNSAELCTGSIYRMMRWKEL